MYTILKKVSRGLVAAALGLTIVIAGSAFKGNSGKKDPQKFRYAGSTYGEGAVEDLSNWIHDNSAPECDPGDERPCTITVDPSYVNPNGTLKSTLNLNASLSPTSSDYIVAGSSDSSMEIVNRAQ